MLEFDDDTWMEFRRTEPASENVLEEIGAIPVGSRVTCDPPPTDTDEDFIAYMEEEETVYALLVPLQENGWEMGGSAVGNGGVGDGGAGDGWYSFRKGNQNLILVYKRPIYDSFMAATAIAKRLNLLRKEDRVALFQELELHWPGVVQR